MQDKPVTLIVSDLHVGGGPADAGDDHVHHKSQFVNFLRSQASTTRGRDGELELIINGDFLEFAQTDTDAFGLLSDDCWCTELQSLRKLNTILAGHPLLFEELQRFQRAGNLVTIAAGNHDVDLFWPAVQARLRQAAGEGIRFEVGQEWVERHDGGLQIGHGHMSDPANRFRNWARPVVTAAFGVECLEMCPGTLFMVKFVNKLEARYPFADNLLPVTKLAAVLLSDDTAGFASVGWMFACFVATTSGTTMGSAGNSNYGARLLTRLQHSPGRSRRLAAILEQFGMQREAVLVDTGALTKDGLASLMFALLGKIEAPLWDELFELPRSGSTLGTNGVTLSAIAHAGFVDGKARLREVAQARSTLKNASVIVMGHTHQPDRVDLAAGAQYFNPGSWTRYLELAPGRSVTLDDLKQEDQYPFQLNCVRVERADAALHSEMLCVDEG
jgi:UDP-2,3-diacylglucosamine pyrophosphatase LpxH